jgi:nicotinate-nucleotide adenylyltransferase
MRFVRKVEGVPSRLGILCGAFHPVTRAHLGLAQSALHSGETEQVLFVLPRQLPHKEYDWVGLDERLELIALAASEESRFSIAISDGGLFLQIARECREHYGPHARLRFLCGRDTAERIVAWPYGGMEPIDRQLQEYELLVAPRQGAYEPPPHLSESIANLAIDEQLDDVSSSAVRERIRSGENWVELIPDKIVDRVRELYGGSLRK